MQAERIPHPTPQEIQVVNLVPEQAIPAMQGAIIDLLQTLPTPITITSHEDRERQTTYYTYQVGEQTEDHSFGIALGATPLISFDTLTFCR
jgi:hypothetical protein